MELTDALRAELLSDAAGRQQTAEAVAAVRGISKWPGGEYFYDEAFLVATTTHLLVYVVEQSGTFRKKTEIRLSGSYAYDELTAVGVDEAANYSLSFSHDPQELYFFPLTAQDEWRGFLGVVADGVTGGGTPSRTPASAGLTPERTQPMTTWAQLQDYVRGNYQLDDDQSDRMRLTFQVDDGRSQLVFLFLQTLQDGHEQWLTIESPIGPAAHVDLTQALALVGNLVSGGLSQIGDLVSLKHSVPIASLDVDAFERPLRLIVTSADLLEQKLVGGDAL